MRTAALSTISLPIHRVDVVESNVPEIDGWIRCEIGENLIVDSASIQSYCLAKWDSCVYDALVLAAAVQYCDLTKRRSSRIWGRDFLLSHDPARWNSNAVSKSLHAALRLLTGDNWQILFTLRRDQFQPPLQSNFCIPSSSGVVIPFSDGLDSFAVAKLMEQQYSSSLIRVRLGSRQLSKRSADCQPFAYVPFRVKTQRTVESSARSRGFKFAMLCSIAAHLLGAKEIVVPESGQGVLGPVLVPVGQGYEDYRCHPIFTDHMTTLVKSLFGHRVRYKFPRLWYTKAQTLREATNGLSDSATLSTTRSCWQSARRVSVSGNLTSACVCMSARSTQRCPGLRSTRSAGLACSSTPTILESVATKPLCTSLGILLRVGGSLPLCVSTGQRSRGKNGTRTRSDGHFLHPYERLLRSSVRSRLEPLC